MTCALLHNESIRNASAALAMRTKFGGVASAPRTVIENPNFTMIFPKRYKLERLSNKFERWEVVMVELSGG